MISTKSDHGKRVNAAKIRVLLTRPDSLGDVETKLLTTAGFEVIREPFIRIETIVDDASRARANRLLTTLSQHPNASLIVTSASAIRALTDLAPDLLEKIAKNGLTNDVIAVGEATAQVLRDCGFTRVAVPEIHSAEGILALLKNRPPGIAVIPAGNLTLSTLGLGLKTLGWQIFTEVLYNTAPVTKPPAFATALRDGRIDVVVLRSPSAVDALVAHVPDIHPHVRIVCVGNTTAATAEKHHLLVCVVVDPSQLADLPVKISQMINGGK